VNEAAQPSLLIGDQEVVHDAIAEVGGEDLARLGACGDEADGRSGPVGVGAQLLLEGQQARLKLICKDQEITDEVEKNIAWYLMLYGKWESTGPTEAKIVDGQFEYAEDTFMPVEPADDEGKGQGFAIIGWLSSMYSAFYRQSTAPKGRIGQVRLEAVPGRLGRLIPEGYHGKSLPLWIFILTPAHPL
jgi:hypothetical protein